MWSVVFVLLLVAAVGVAFFTLLPNNREEDNKVLYPNDLEEEGNIYLDDDDEDE